MSVDVYKYVYGVVCASAVAPTRVGVGGAPVELIACGATAAVVSDVRERELDAGRQELMTHAEVLEDALRDGVVLPMRFGVVMADGEAVRRELLQRHHDVLLSQLSELAGKVELRLRAVFEEAAVVGEVLREDAEIAALRDALRGCDEDATYYERIRLGEMVADAVARKCEAEGEEILRALAPLALAVDRGGGAHERMALNASFLVERDRVVEFDEAVDELGRVRDGRLRLKYTGPLPPYSFVELPAEG
ncbi:MAG: GvpL/GvpF family gas vesicle protein [Actinobacteria bacterium]|nr:GvpL/GvpF family gas vesicle protein [Actinomycetota bacterium]